MGGQRTDIPGIIGHRGAAGHAPENTLIGLRKAKELGCTWVEFDCMLTREKLVILHHDETLERTTNGTGLVSEAGFAEIRRLDAGFWFSRDYEGTSIPSLDQAIATLKELQTGANVEIKPVRGYERETGKRVAREVADKWPETLPRPVLSSFSLEALEAAMREAPHLDRAVLWWDIPADWEDHHKRLHASAAHVSASRLSKDQADLFKARQTPMRSYTVNDPLEVEKLFSWGCETIFTDYPDRFL
jgi:glycerophosphoryl diester phosphodiesterase